MHPFCLSPFFPFSLILVVCVSDRSAVPSQPPLASAALGRVVHRACLAQESHPSDRIAMLAPPIKRETDGVTNPPMPDDSPRGSADGRVDPPSSSSRPIRPPLFLRSGVVGEHVQERKMTMSASSMADRGRSGQTDSRVHLCRLTRPEPVRLRGRWLASNMRDGFSLWATHSFTFAVSPITALHGAWTLRCGHWMGTAEGRGEWRQCE